MNKAMALFEEVVQLEKNKEIKYSFKALASISIIAIHIQQIDKLSKSLEQLLAVMPKVGTNEAEEGIKSLLDVSSKSSNTKISQIVNDKLLKSLRTLNEKMWITITMRSCKNCLENNDMEKMEKMLEELRGLVMLPNGNYDDRKVNVFDFLALEIKLASRNKDLPKMKKLYGFTQRNLSEGLSDPRSLSIIQDTGARINFIEKNWEKSRILFFDAFKNYQVIASPDAKRMLQFAVIASILSYSTINPLFSQEGRVYAETPEFVKLDQFRKAFDNNDIPVLLNLCDDKKFLINDDKEISQFKNDIMRNIRLKVIVSFVQPYDTVSLNYMAKELKINVKELIVLLTDLILESKLNGKIDEISGILNLKPDSVDQNIAQQRKMIEKIGQSLHRMMDLKYSKISKHEY